MDVKFLEDEHQALSGDKVELTEYVQSLQFQIVKLKVSIFLYSFLANVSMSRSQQLTILLS